MVLVTIFTELLWKQANRKFHPIRLRDSGLHSYPCAAAVFAVPGHVSIRRIRRDDLLSLAIATRPWADGYVIFPSAGKGRHLPNPQRACK